MDAEQLKCKKTHDIMSTFLPMARRLMYLINYCNYSGKYADDIEYVRFKRDFVDAHEKRKKKKTLPSLNISEFALDSVHRSLYHQCRSDVDHEHGRMFMFKKLKDLTNVWKRIVLGLEPISENGILGLYEGFSQIAGYINFPPGALDEGQGCHCCFCIINSIYCDLGWTDLVCPRQAGEQPQTNCVSKRGIVEGMREGYCEHLVHTKKTKYDRICRGVL